MNSDQLVKFQINLLTDLLLYLLTDLLMHSLTPSTLTVVLTDAMPDSLNTYRRTY